MPMQRLDNKYSNLNSPSWAILFGSLQEGRVGPNGGLAGPRGGITGLSFVSDVVLGVGVGDPVLPLKT